MKKIWVETRTIKQPEGTVSGRFGSSVMFVFYFKALDEWRWVQPNSIEERIAEPQMVYVDEEWARKNTLKTPRGRCEKPTRIHRKRHDQLSFDLE